MDNALSPSEMRGMLRQKIELYQEQLAGGVANSTMARIFCRAIECMEEAAAELESATKQS